MVLSRCTMAEKWRYVSPLFFILGEWRCISGRPGEGSQSTGRYFHSYLHSIQMRCFFIYISAKGYDYLSKPMLLLLICRGQRCELNKLITTFNIMGLDVGDRRLSSSILYFFHR